MQPFCEYDEQPGSRTDQDLARAGSALGMVNNESNSMLAVSVQMSKQIQFGRHFGLSLTPERAHFRALEPLRGIVFAA